jgi:ubiquinone/menaquinone biosynthesis C-methylase UbiE
MVDFRDIYNNQAEAYDQLVAHEDYQGNIMRSLQAIRSVEGLSAIDLGAGTGRIARLLYPHAEWVLAMDISGHMLGKAREHLGHITGENCHLVQADNLNLPLCEEVADIVTAGWTLGHFTGWYPNTWPSKVDRCLTEMRRVLRPGGTAIILETLGTGRESPHPPTEALARYYAHLEDDLGFSSRWIRSDYHFQSLDQAIQLCQFFFGEALAKEVENSDSQYLPECTGIWWLNI